jgi:omega-amidase
VRPLTLALVQTARRWHDAAANRALFDAWFDAVPDTADIVVLPEMFSTGFTMAAAEVAEPMDGPTVGWLRTTARRLDKVVCGSLVIAEGGECFNRFVWMRPDGAVVTYDKRHRFRMAGEHAHYAAGSVRQVIALGDWRILPVVCYDLRFPVWLRNRGDYDLLLVVANWPAARKLAWDTLLRARAIENLACVAGVNIVGTDGNHVAYTGGTVAYGPDGAALLESVADPGVYCVTLDGYALTTFRSQFPAWQDADDFSLDVGAQDPQDASRFAETNPQGTG